VPLSDRNSKSLGTAALSCDLLWVAIYASTKHFAVPRVDHA